MGGWVEASGREERVIDKKEVNLNPNWHFGHMMSIFGWGSKTFKS